MLAALFHILIFPGLLFLMAYSLFFDFVDRKIYARLQNRTGPRWYQPLADFLKLLGKETIIPDHAAKKIFTFLPIVSMAAIAAAYLYIPLFLPESLYPFDGDLIVVLYLLTIPTVCFFLAGWFSTSVFATIGAVRTLTQLFSYEVPLFMALLAPALLADTWSLSGITAYYSQHPFYLLLNIPAFLVAIIACQGKLDRVPFDLSEAETELASGTFVEYSGRYYAIFRLAIDCELVVVSSLIAAVYLPMHSDSLLLGIVIYVLETLLILFILALIRTIMARIRIEQMVVLCWKYLTPIALLQIIANLLLKGVL
ncbi:MAG: NADH-quinone oxidoreductase subunit H [Firmicutes bacterium]|nr:NADH-quinone oxidoreductase subunit H [Bacillota bacterium]